MEQIGTIAAEVGGTDAKIGQLSAQLSPLVEDATSRSRNAEAEAREETLRDVLINRVESAGGRGITAVDLGSDILAQNAAWGHDFFAELWRLKQEGIISYGASKSGGIMPDADERIIYIAGQSRRKT
jgi:hypothetical protein